MIRAVAFALMIFLLLTGCSQHKTPDLSDNTRSRIALKQELANTIGNPDRTPDESGWNDLLLSDGNTLSDRTEYAAPTGEWFESSVRDPLLFSYPGGIRQPGEKISVVFGENPANRTIRIQLTGRDESLQNTGMISETLERLSGTTFPAAQFDFQLPYEEGALYLLSIEILGEQEEIEDTFLSLMYVPKREVNAKLLLADANDAHSAGRVLKLYNAGPSILYLGEDYHIEKNVGGTWMEHSIDKEFPAVGISLNPGQTYERTIRINGLDPGRYRVVKAFSTMGYSAEHTLASEFEVKESAPSSQP